MGGRGATESDSNSRVQQSMIKVDSGKREIKTLLKKKDYLVGAIPRGGNTWWGQYVVGDTRARVRC